MRKSTQFTQITTNVLMKWDQYPNVLLKKLMVAGIHGDLLLWFASYIDNRSQAIVLRGFMFRWTPVLSGVSQGFILGPLFSIIFISDKSVSVKVIRV